MHPIGENPKLGWGAANFGAPLGPWCSGWLPTNHAWQICSTCQFDVLENGSSSFQNHEGLVRLRGPKQGHVQICPTCQFDVPESESSRFRNHEGLVRLRGPKQGHVQICPCVRIRYSENAPSSFQNHEGLV